MQFAYKRGRSTDDAVATLIHNVTKHIEKAGNYIRILFIYISLAFNIIQRHKMIEMLLALQIPKHLEKAGNYICILFIDFSSAFNTIQHHKMIEKLLALQIPPKFINWMHNNFLSNRPQHLKAGSNISPNIITNTGAPQGANVTLMS